MVFPKLQVSVAAAMLFIQNFSEMLIFPFLPFFVHSFYPHIPKHTLGFYVGWVGSAFYLANTIFNVMWGKLADRIGRKPILVFGSFSAGAAVLLFGFSWNYPMLIVSRFVWGALNANTALSKTVISEVCEKGQMTQAFAIIGVLMGIGRLLGPSCGGFLAQPASNWPSVFSPDGFFGKHPFVLPTMIACLLCWIQGVVVIIYLKETLPSKVKEEEKPLKSSIGGPYDSAAPVLVTADQSINSETEEDAIIITQLHEHIDNYTTTALLRDRVVFLSCLIFGLFAFATIMASELLPLWLLNNRAHHGFHFKEENIGLLMTEVSITEALMQVLVIVPLQKKLGYKKMALVSIFLMGVSLLGLPWTVYSQDWGSRDGAIAILTVVVVFFFDVSVLAFVSVLIFVANASPSFVRASVTGLSQSFASFGRMIGPTLGSVVFAWSQDNHLGYPLNFQFMWIVIAITLFAIAFIVRKLPDSIETERLSMEDENV